MSCIKPVPSVANILKKLYPSATILNEFTSTYYNDKNYSFEILFQKYKDSGFNNIYHPDIIG